MENLECGIAAHGVVQADHARIMSLRKKPAASDAYSFPINFLKYADNQTVVALAAIFQAIDDAGLSNWSFREWGVVAGPCFLGRESFVGALDRFRRQGAL